MIDELVIALLNAKQDAANRGFWRTMHSLDEALQHLGWDLAEDHAREFGGDDEATRVRKLADKYMAMRYE